MALTKISSGLISDDAISTASLADGIIQAAHLHASHGITTANIAEGSNQYHTTARARAAVSVGGSLAYNSSTGVVSFTQRTDGTIRGLVSVTDSGGDGSLAYNNSTGVITYTGPSASEVRAHLSAGTGVTYSSGAISIGQSVATNATPTFGNITTTGYIAGPASFTIDPAAVGDNTGTVVIAGNLQVDGTTTTINSTTVAIDDLNFSIATDAADSAAANGAGITIGGASATMLYTHATTSFDFNKPVNVTGNIGVSGTVDGIDIATRDAILTSTTTTAGAALPKAGGTLTGVTNIASSATASALLTVHNSFSSDANNALLVRGGANESDGKVLEVQDHAGNSDFVVMGDGKVGIGTTNPYATLRVKLAAARATGYDPDNALTWADVMVVNPSGADTSATGIGFYNHGSYHANAASGIALVKHTASTDYGSDMAFIVRPQAAVAQEWMRLTSTGRLGIGTTDPTHKFHVADGNNYAVLGDTQDNSTMSLRMADTTTFPVEVQAYSSELRFNTATTSGATPSAKMRIMPSGYVHVDGASDLRFTLGSQGTAGNNDSNWLRGNGTTLSYNSASGDHIWEIGGTEHMRLDSAASASVPQLEIKDTHPWIDMVAPDGSVFKSGITMRGGSSSTQAQSHFHLTRDSGYRTLASAGNYDTYIDTTTANTAYGNFLIGTNNTEAIRVLATNQYVGIGNQAPTKQLVVMSSTDSNQMLVHLNNDTAGASSAIYFKADSQITGNSNTFTRAKGGIFFSRISTRGTGHMYLAVDGVNSDTNASPGGAQLKLTSNPNHGGGLVLKNSAHTVVGRDYTNGVLTNGQSVSWNGSGTTKTDSLLNMNGVGGNGGAWIAGISVSSADGSPSGAAVQVGVHGMTFNAFSTLVNQFDSGLSVTIGAQISISNTSGDTVYYRVNVIPLGSRETTVYGR